MKRSRLLDAARACLSCKTAFRATGHLTAVITTNHSQTEQQAVIPGHHSGKRSIPHGWVDSVQT